MRISKFLEVMALILAIFCSGCASEGHQKSLSSKSFDWTGKCLGETQAVLRSAGFYDLNPKSINDIINWSNADNADLFHVKLRKFRDETPHDLDITNARHQEIIARKFSVIFQKLFSKECQVASLPFLKSQLETVAAQNFNIEFLDIQTSRRFFLSIVYQSKAPDRKAP